METIVSILKKNTANEWCKVWAMLGNGSNIVWFPDKLNFNYALGSPLYITKNYSIISLKNQYLLNSAFNCGCASVMTSHMSAEDATASMARMNPSFSILHDLSSVSRQSTIWSSTIFLVLYSMRTYVMNVAQWPGESIRPSPQRISGLGQISKVLLLSALHRSSMAGPQYLFCTLRLHKEVIVISFNAKY